MTSKHKKMDEGSKKHRSFRMCLSLNREQFKTSRVTGQHIRSHIYVITNRRPIIDTQNQKEKYKYTTKENH